ncbi:GNAT superfamily N-acetyltransferase [Rhizobium leguminosarum]|nr:GNAT superfamily N-acetyltransferase [Rhizobium leguminosarum]
MGAGLGYIRTPRQGLSCQPTHRQHEGRSRHPCPHSASTPSLARRPHPLWSAAWNTPNPPDFSRILPRSLAHIGAYHDNRLVGFGNVAWDGGIHAFLLDTCVHPDMRRQGIATQLVREAMRTARERGAEWLHVDFEPHLTSFYRACSFRPTWAS